MPLWDFEYDCLTPAQCDCKPAFAKRHRITAENFSAPAMQDFVRKLAEYSKNHPDFAPIAAKYRLTDSLGKAATTSTSSPSSGVPKK